MEILTGRQHKYHPGETLMAGLTGAALGPVAEHLFGGGGGCFVAGTPVQSIVKGADGKFHVVVKPIEKMRKDGLVLARDEKTGKTQVRRVLKTTVRQVGLVLTVALADAKTRKVVERITATREHPFYVRGKGFVPAGGLAVGNAIVTRAGPALVVQSITWNRRAEGYKVYNFVVEDDHSYFVGKSGGGVWVHNPLCPGDAGAYADLVSQGSVGDRITPHHMPQNALGFLSTDEGGALAMPHADHVLTRTYGYRGALTATQDAGLDFRTALARDIRDIRSRFGSKYDNGIRDLLNYYRTNYPQLIGK